jgi:glucose/arabinose dehydrogenase
MGAGLKGPAGLSASVYATGIVNVASLAFDSQGRLWAGTAAFEDTGTDAIYVVPSEGAEPVAVATGLHTVLGLLWRGDELFVASKGHVDAYSGFDGSRFGSRRFVVVLPSGVGEVNGLVLSPEGRLVLGISAPCNACEPAMPMSGAVVSFLPDGSDLRVVASGIRAPIGLAYYPGSDDLFVTMNQRDDLGDSTPGDWLAVVRFGEDWGFPDCYGQAGAACSGVPTPVAELDKHAAVSGIAIVSGQMGPSARNSAIVAEWATGKLVAVSLKQANGGYEAAVSTFIEGIENPVPVVLGPSGALFAGDWTSGVVYRVSP